MAGHARLRAEMAAQLAETRGRTLALAGAAEGAYCRRLHPFYSPMGWHLGHVGMTEAFPYPAYSEPHFGTCRVLKGGSWATRGPLLRCAFRNFYPPDYRQGLIGFRCARSLDGDGRG